MGADQIDQGRFAGAVGADQGEKLALVDGEVEPVARLRLAELLAQIHRPQQGHVGGLPTPSRRPSCDSAPTIPVGNTNTRTTSTTPSSSCQYSVVATA